MTRLHIDTPLIESLSINKELDATVWLKMEALQPCGSFKARGIGYASIIDEISSAGIVPDALVLSVGGGGLLCGVVKGVNRNNWKSVPILAVETKGADSLNAASLANKHVGIDRINSIATSLGAKKVAKRAFELLNEHQIVNHIVTDKDAINGCYRFLEDHRIMVEPACGASLSAVYDGCDFLKDKHNVVVIVCGGVGVTMGQLKEWSQHVT
ncbi:pyridoxal-phosphate dependent enzyme [Desulfobacula sp.]|uniref:pyridoxal-phosphate dependent enzyme n=1 Tax=Desulfobacula sp. TaxID=2593537 RepID=UPI0025C5D08C|nr:pyridoxal-phosphate dependent enzyme [Desulfobacula sp.]MBC2705118.1 pyridoxal-phosphate dependent enzyme [Desulfobacula sp.]